MPRIPSQVLAILVPVSFFEDIHSEDFWNVIMQSFDVSLFKLRVVSQVSQATQIKRGVASVSQVTAFEWTTLDNISTNAGIRFTGRDDFNNGFGAFVRGAAAMDPASRRTGKVAFGIKQILEAVDQYWDNCQQLSALADTFASNSQQISQLNATLTVTSTEQDKTKWVQLLWDQVNIVEHAIKEHEGQVQAIERIAATRSFLDEERRGALRAWNYDTRIFLRAIGKFLKGDTTSQIQNQPLDLRLEVTRVRVWHYLEPSVVNSNDNRELLDLRELWDTRMKLLIEGKRIEPVLDRCLELRKSQDRDARSIPPWL
ncbi:hypothetical protein BKA64DRAFT_744793 [Cadophora sp. MPI-SDFR-AT-0126]|nr:hypothetical protein BKA64DRAFT_744793 [Leotiomycetes sp. MPI-SDFR-AT-0126]